MLLQKGVADGSPLVWLGAHQEALRFRRVGDPWPEASACVTPPLATLLGASADLGCQERWLWVGLPSPFQSPTSQPAYSIPFIHISILFIELKTKQSDTNVTDFWMKGGRKKNNLILSDLWPLTPTRPFLFLAPTTSLKAAVLPPFFPHSDAATRLAD